MPDKNILWTAARCRHYAMCKIDYLGTGLCPAGAAKPYVAYFPQGRMDLVDALARGVIPVTEGLLDIADSCDLCGACDLQCHFYTSLRPLPVMASLKETAAAHRSSGAPTARAPEDPLLGKLRAIVGRDWASNDPAVAVAYSHDPFPLARPRMPRAVVLPGSAEEVEAVVRLAARSRVPFAVRGNGASVYAQVYSEGLVLDMVRMREIDFDPANWTVTVGPGVTAFDLQREASRRGYRVNVAEPAATVIGNIICTGLFSTWAAGYGLGADHVVDMEFVDRRGRRVRLSDGENGGASLLAYRHRVGQVPGVCTRAKIRLQPVTGDEQGLLVPFGDFAEAVAFARELSVRRIGFAVAVLGPHFMGTFMAVSPSLEEAAKRAFETDLGMPFAVYVVADRFGLQSVRAMAGKPVVDQDLYRVLALGLPKAVNGRLQGLLRGIETDRPPIETFAEPSARPIIEAVLDPSPATLASAVDPDLREAYERLYRRPELTDLVWLNEFRIVSARMCRAKHVVVWLMYVPLDAGFISSLSERLESTARELGISHAYGFVTPVDLGKRAIFEYDYYIDHPDPDEKDKIARAMTTLEPWLDGLSAGPDSNMTWLKTVFTQGSARKESWYYRDFAGRPNAG